LEDVRNISFHYPSADELNSAFHALPDNEPWCFYLSKANSNSLYYVSELVMQRAMLGEIKVDSASHIPVDAQLKLALDKALKNVFDTLTCVANKLVKIFEAYNEILFEKYFSDACAVPAVRLSAPDLNKVGIPFFVEREGRT
jgi:hypothetical protein